MPFEKLIEIREALGHPFLEQRQEDILLALEVRVEGATGVTSSGSDVFQTRGLESVPRKNPLRSCKKPSTGCFCARLLARGGCFGSSRPKGRTERVVPDDQAR